eukprot:comp12740_c0_seq1/m.7859 comp12740_c0_seq1/g.7859  ORF comp12740_c0_seq1/g.7859 comp12740_c0_seq1/m.7859 type:complete len:313 (-) comp12740_c0_seq1:254-1192(-)
MADPNASLFSDVVSSLQVLLHPLVLVHISDHFTRRRVQGGDGEQNPRVIGALLGTQDGRNVEVFNAFELLTRVEGGELIIDPPYFQSKQEQFKQVFPTYDFLGWYCTGPDPISENMKIHKQIMQLGNENPLFLRLDSGSTTDSALPVEVLETMIEMVGGQPRTLFVRVPYKIETGEAERIALDHIARTAVTNESQQNTTSQVSSHLRNQSNAVHMLYKRIKILVDYCIAVDRRELPEDASILQDIASLCNRLPVMDSPDFKQELLSEYNDVLLMTYLATITKGANAINELAGKVTAIHADRGKGIRPLGQFF